MDGFPGQKGDRGFPGEIGDVGPTVKGEKGTLPNQLLEWNTNQNC